MTDYPKTSSLHIEEYIQQDDLETIVKGLVKRNSKKCKSIFLKTKAITEKSAELLSSLLYGDIIIKWLKSITPNAAKKLSQLPRGDIRLDDVIELAPEVGWNLSKLADWDLYLNWLETIDQETAKKLSNLPNWSLHLWIKQITEYVSRELAKLQWWDLYLNQLKIIDKDSAEELSQLPNGDLYLNWLETIDVETARSLIKLSNWDIYLKWLKSVSPEVDQVLSDFKGNIYLPKTIRDKVNAWINLVETLSHPSISIITPTHDPKFIFRTAQSVLLQTYWDFEWIIVDNTKDEEKGRALVNIVNKLHDKRIRIIRNDKVGIPESRNVWIKNARWEFIAFLDHDDLWRSDKLKRQTRYLKKNPAIWWVWTNVVNIGDSGTLKSQRIHPTWPNECVNKAIVDMPALLSATLFRKNNLLNIANEQGNVLDEEFDYVDDYDLFLRFMEKFQLGNIQKNLTYYRFWSGNTTSQNRDKMVKETLIAIKKSAKRHPQYRVRLSLKMAASLASPEQKRRLRNVLSF